MSDEQSQLVLLTYAAAERLLKVKQTQLEMMRDRGADISKEEGLLTYDPTDPTSVNAFMDLYRNYVIANKIPFRQALNYVYTIRNRSTLVYYASAESTSKLGVNPLSVVLNEAKSIGSLSALIIISEADLSPDARKVIADVQTYHIQHFFDEQLMYNLTKHVYVPPHRLLSDEEAREFLIKNRLKPTQFPLLKFIDPVSRLNEKDRRKHPDPMVSYYGYQPGQIIEIDRINDNIESLTKKIKGYRIVSY